MGPPQIDDWNATGHRSQILGLSPSLFSSPAKLQPEQILEDGAKHLTQGEHRGSFRKNTCSDTHQVCSPVLAVLDNQG